ncbi:MAG: hypothetical protein LBC88_08665 [Spirochaetaceae bacterium]|nr:hypothetical protein [Spirochaetaceae bacterium]
MEGLAVVMHAKPNGSVSGAACFYTKYVITLHTKLSTAQGRSCGAPEEGWVYRNTANRNIYRYDGQGWVMIGDGSLNPSSAGVGVDDNTSSSFAGVTAFGQGGWPTAATDTTPSNGLSGTYAGAWETGAGKYWKSLGNWNGGNYGRDSDFPRLWWEP